jgi:hypothetical protein
MGILTNRIAFSGTATGADVVHMVDVSDTTDGPDGTSFKTPLSALTAYFSASGDTYTTGFTYDNANTFTISQNEGEPPLSSTFNIVTGLTSTGTITTNTLSATTIDATSITTNTLSATTIDATSLTVNGSPINSGGTGGGGLTWVTTLGAGGNTVFANSNHGYVSKNTHQSNGTIFWLPTTASTGDIVKVLCRSGRATLACDASQLVIYGTGWNSTGGSFTDPLDFYFGTGESVEAVYMGDNQWIIDNFMTMEFNLDITTRIFV